MYHYICGGNEQLNSVWQQRELPDLEPNKNMLEDTFAYPLNTNMFNRKHSNRQCREEASFHGRLLSWLYREKFD